MQEGAFSFALYQSDENGVYGEELQRVGNNDNGIAVFSPLVFYHDILFAAYVNPTDDDSSSTAGNPGETDVKLYYLVHELVHETGDYSERTGIVFDEESVLFKIVVHHEANHHLSVTSTEYRKGNGAWQTFSGDHLPVFSNTDKTHSLIELNASKRLSGRDWNEEDRFEFTVTALDGAPMNGKTSLRAVADNGKRDVWFESIRVTPADLYDQKTGKYLKEKTFRYRIHEYADDGHGGDRNDGSGDATSARGTNGFVYAADIIVTVKVKELDDGSLHVAYGEREETQMTLPEFLNEWKEIPPDDKPIPKTGDGARIILWTALALIGLAGTGIFAIRRKR